MRKIMVLMGVTCAGKSTITNTNNLQIKGCNIYILSSDKMREQYGLEECSCEVFKLIEQEITKISKENNSYCCIIDSTNLSYKRQNQWKLLSKRTKSEIEFVYKITHPQIWEQNVKKRIETKWINYTPERVINIKKNMLLALNLPDNVKFITKDIAIDKREIEMFKDYYKTNQELFLTNPQCFFQNALNLEKVIPELVSTFNFDQESQYHIDDLFNHLIKTTNYFVANSLTNYLTLEQKIWVGILHDIGKSVEGIKLRKEDGNCSYIGHAGVSAELAILILKRLGFDNDFIFKVAQIISLHMVLPYEMTEKSKNKLINRYSPEIFYTLQEFRVADKIR